MIYQLMAPPMEGAEAFKKRLDSDVQRWGRVIKQANIPIE